MHRTRSTITALLLLLLSCVCTASALAVTPEFSASFRARTEGDWHRGFPPSLGPPDKATSDDTLNLLSFLRTQLSLKLTKDTTTHVFIQIQDSRVYGETPGTSGGLINDVNLGIHQAYVDLRHWIWYRLESRVGRQVVSWGNERLMGGVGWHNVGRSFDGGRLALAFTKVRLEAALFTLLERDSRTRNQGSGADNLMGYLVFQLPDSKTDFMLIGDGDFSRPTPSGRRLKRSTLAAYSQRTFAGSLDYIANLALQGGTAIDTNISTSKMDIEAYLIALEMGYTIPGKAKARFSLGIDYASGNNHDDTTKYKEFNNLYYTGHKFRGLMDNFLGPAAAPVGSLGATMGPGLNDMYGRFHFDFHPRWRLGVDMHYFQTAGKYGSAQDGSDTRKVGAEIDAWVRLKELRGVRWQYGMSLFFWDRDRVGPDAETTQLWAYTQLQVDVK